MAINFKPNDGSISYPAGSKEVKFQGGIQTASTIPNGQSKPKVLQRVGSPKKTGAPMTISIQKGMDLFAVPRLKNQKISSKLRSLSNPFVR